MPGGRARYIHPPRGGVCLHTPNEGDLPFEGDLGSPGPKAPASLVGEAGSCFCLKNKKAKNLAKWLSEKHPHSHACPSPSIPFSPQTHLNLPPTISGQKAGDQGRAACRHPRTPVHVSAFPVTQTPARGRCQCKATAQKGRAGSPLEDYKPEMHLFMETGAGRWSAGREPRPHHCGPTDPSTCSNAG